MPKICAFIPTKNRPESLKLALKSISSQNKKPDRTVIISDCSHDFEVKTREIVNQFEHYISNIELIRNQRTPNLSGALNSGILHLFEKNENIENTFIAFLDDDDQWETDHLALCLEKAIEENLDFVFSGLIRHESMGDAGVYLNIPDILHPDDFLVTNPHIQGSNIFVRLNALLMAGGLDEFLESTTDRDLCIRLLDLGTLTYGAVRRHTVHHRALSNSDRLSIPCSKRKCGGLNAFFYKYSPRMSCEEIEKFKKRAIDIFGCVIQCPMDSVQPRRLGGNLDSDSILIQNKSSYFPLVVGFIASRLNSTRNLFSDLIELCNNSQLTGPCLIRKVIIYDNSYSTTELERIVSELNVLELDVRIVLPQKIEMDCDNGVFGSYFYDENNRQGIAAGRTILHHYLYEEAKKIPGSVVWVLDDDIRLDFLTVENNFKKISMGDLQNAILQMKQEGVSIANGDITGDSPIPPNSTIRTQLLDFFYNLKQFEKRAENNSCIDISIFNILKNANKHLMKKYPDYYYDYSEQHYSHLEVPFWFPAREKEDLKNLIGEFPAIGFGKNIFRPVVESRSLNRDELPLSRDQVIPRGGNSIIINIECLRHFPNITPRIGDISIRRGDTFWCLLNDRIKGFRVAKFPISVRQERTIEATKTFNLEHLLGDFYGSSFIRAMNEYYLKKIEEKGAVPRRIQLAFEKNDIDFIIESFEHHLKRRLRQFFFNAYRIKGLIQSISFTLNSETFSGIENIKGANDFLSELDTIYSADNINWLYSKGMGYSDADLRVFLVNFKEYTKTYRSNLNNDFTPAYRRHARSIIASILAEKSNNSDQNLEYLGHGNEGIVFSDGNYAYKYFYYGKANFQEGIFDLVAEKVLRNELLKHTIELLEIIERQGELVFVMKYEASLPYQGGYLSDIFEILRECRDAGIAYTNFHPKNLIIANNSLKLVDIGDSIIPFNEYEFTHMCKRAYLTYRWHFREDISKLMEKTIYSESIPELAEIEHFFKAIDTINKSKLLDHKIVELSDASTHCTIFDFGCGKGSISESLAKKGHHIVAYDIDELLIKRNKDTLSYAKYINREEFLNLKASGKKFDKIICVLVLCTIEDEREFYGVISDMRDLIEDNGEAIMAFCNPFSSFVIETESHKKINVPSEDKYYQKFVYHKKVKETGGLRKEIHRSFRYYHHAFHFNGFEITDVEEIGSTDVEDLCPSSDFIIARLRPLKYPLKKAVSLLIKASAMEWESIDFQIRHIIKQLEGPQIFLEKVVVTDNSEGSFSRQYATANLKEFEKKLKQLIAEGIIDRVITAPNDTEIIEQTYKKWFGVSSCISHCANGQPTYMSLYGMDMCRGEYILQLDSDCLFVRKDRNHDYLKDMIRVFEEDPRTISVSFNIAHNEDKEYTHTNLNWKWRTEVRCSLFHKKRLETVLPFPNVCDEDGILQFPWHRALDSHLRQTELRSYRGGDFRTFYIHVPNEYKKDINRWYNFVLAAERGEVPELQYDHVDLQGKLRDWIKPVNSNFIFIVRGRNVSVPKFRRCMASLLRQKSKNWGAVIIDAASENSVPEYIEEIVWPRLKDRVAILKNYSPLTSMENNMLAISELCSNPKSIIITLDSDDALIGNQVLDILLEYYSSGADLTVGTMLRTDKFKEYPVDFSDPRRNRGGNVWQHLRSFKKILFDKIPCEYFKLDGKWVNFAEDWAFMLPMVEIAQNPKFVKEILYFYEPSGEKGPETQNRREAIISKIVSKETLKNR